MFGPPTAKTAARGYGKAHQQLRAAWAPKVATGRVLCWRCGYPIQVGEAWDLGHDDHDRSIYRGPEHRHRTAHCKGNRLAGLIKAANNNHKRRKGIAVPTQVLVAPKPRPKAQPKAKTPRPPCAMCGVPLPKGRKRHCSDRCQLEYNNRNSRERYRKQQGLPSTWDRESNRRPATASRW